MLNATLQIEGLAQPLLMVSYCYRDELSKPFELDIEALFEEAAPDLEQLIGAAATAAFPEERYLPEVRGLVVEAEQLTVDPKARTHVRVKIAPPIALLAHRSGSRIEQHKSLIEIARGVAASISDTPYLRVSESHAEREYTVQYHETDLTFMERMLAEAGAGFFHDHTAKSALVMFDDISAAVSVSARVPYRPYETRIEAQPHVRYCQASARVRPGKVSLDDYDYERPDYDMAGDHRARAPRKHEDVLEHFELEAEDVKKAGDARELAKKILDSLRTQASTAQLQASFALTAGSEIVVEDAPRPELADPLIVLASEVRVEKNERSEKQTHSRLLVVPKSTKLRPKRIAKPRIWGTQTAFVVGDPGEEIDVDEQGRVKVLFHWDRRRIREGEPTRRIRVSQAWAGPGYGLMNVPRVGDEVVVAYLDGDPDEPLIVGRVHNVKAPPPLQLPAEKTRSIWKSKSSPGGQGENHIFLEDQAGSELVEISGQRDVQVHANRNYHRDIGQDERRDIGRHSDEDIKGHHRLHIGGPEQIRVDGTQDVSIGGAQSIETPSQSVTVHGKQVIHTGSTTLTSGPIGINGNKIIIDGSSEVGVKAPNIALEGAAFVSTKGTAVKVQAVIATTRAPVIGVNAEAMLAMSGGSSASLHGGTVSVSGDTVIELAAGTNVTITGGGNVNISGSGKVNINGTGQVNIGGASVNITGSPINID